MSKKNRKKKSAATTPTGADQPLAARSSRFQFFVWISAFFFFAALLLRLDVITVWPGAGGYSLDYALSNERHGSMLSFAYNLRLIFRTITAIIRIALGQTEFADPPEMPDARRILDQNATERAAAA